MLALSSNPANAETHRILFLYQDPWGGKDNCAGCSSYGGYFATFGQVDYRELRGIESLANILQWLIDSNYDLVIFEDACVDTGAYAPAAERTIGSVSQYINYTGKSLLILIGGHLGGIYGTYGKYVSGFGAVPVYHEYYPEAETNLIVEHETTTGVRGIYIASSYSLSIHRGFLTPLAYAPKEWWGLSEVTEAGAVGIYGNGKVAYASATDLISNSEKADNNRLMINIVNWLLGKPVGPEELPIELKSLEEEREKIISEVSELNDTKISLEQEIVELEAQKEEVINNLPIVISLREQLTELTNKYANINNIMYLFAGTTLIFLIATIIFALRKPLRGKSQGIEQVHRLLKLDILKR